MAKEKKPPPLGGMEESSHETALPPMTDLEEEVCLVCLRYFHGDWELYQDYLAGPRVSEPQRQQEWPVVRRLSERDRRTGFLTAFLEDRVVEQAEGLSFAGLHRLWELCLLLNPAADPFLSADEQEYGPTDHDLPPDESPTSLH